MNNQDNQGYEVIGSATIDGAVTTIRKYENGFYAVEVNREVKYFAETESELVQKLNEDGINHSLSSDSKE